MKPGHESQESSFRPRSDREIQTRIALLNWGRRRGFGPDNINRLFFQFWRNHQGDFRDDGGLQPKSNS